MPPRDRLRLDHVVVWVGDMGRTSSFLTDVMGWQRHPLEIGIDADETTGGMRGAFFDAGGFWLELILPTGPGPGMDILNEKGAGAMVEIDFEAIDYDAVLERMRARGIRMLNMDGTPLRNGGTIQEGVIEGGRVEEPGQRIAYWPTRLTRGTAVEVYERGDETSLIVARDRQWANPERDPTVARLDRIAIFVEDLEQSAHFYTDVLGLARHPMRFGLEADANEEVGGMSGAFIDANGLWLALVQPRGPGPLMDTLKEKGDGYLAELIAEVDDLGRFYDDMQAKGIQLRGLDGEPFTGSEKGSVLEPYGDKIAYLPEDVSCGMTIEVCQRGPRKTSLLHRRDDDWPPQGGRSAS
jgi:catechol 2,3-dioxygenase-like lactoylglutathione lyase family enzyme